MREMLLTSNRSLAEYNLSREPNLTSGREKLIESHQNREILEAQFEKNKKTLGMNCIYIIRYELYYITLLPIIVIIIIQ